MRNTRKSQWVGNFVGIECLNVVLFGDNTNGVGITKVVDAYHLPRLVLLNGQQDIERFRINAALAVNLDMHAVNEQDWIVCFQPVPESGPCCTMCLQVSHTLPPDSSALREYVGENYRTCHAVS